MDVYVCAICGESATEIYSVGRFEEVNCPGCGEYHVSRSLLQDMRSRKQGFNVELTRECINRFLAAGKQPTISIAEVTVYQLLAK